MNTVRHYLETLREHGHILEVRLVKAILRVVDPEGTQRVAPRRHKGLVCIPAGIEPLTGRRRTLRATVSVWVNSNEHLPVRHLDSLRVGGKGDLDPPDSAMASRNLSVFLQIERSE